jgi:hypothetical protein
LDQHYKDDYSLKLKLKSTLKTLGSTYKKHSIYIFEYLDLKHNWNFLEFWNHHIWCLVMRHHMPSGKRNSLYMKFFKVDVNGYLPYENCCCLLKIRFLKLLLKFCWFIKIDADVIEDSKLMNCLGSLLKRMSIDEFKDHIIIPSSRTMIWIFVS